MMRSMKMAFDPFDEEFSKRFFRRLEDFNKEFGDGEKVQVGFS
jgi:hypothetical protein